MVQIVVCINIVLGRQVHTGSRKKKWWEGGGLSTWYEVVHRVVILVGSMGRVVS